MSDDKCKAGRQDHERINVDEDYELRHWSKKLRVTKDKIKKAVQEVGPSAVAVRKYLGRDRDTA